MRTVTLLFFAVASLLIGAAAMPTAVTLIDAYQASGDPQILQGVYGYFVAAVAVVAPAGFFVGALASALAGADAAPVGSVSRDAETLARLAALGDPPARDPNERFGPARRGSARGAGE